MTAKARRREAPASLEAAELVPWSWGCPDCVGETVIQCGEWGWLAHRFWLHGEGENPGPGPIAGAPERERPLWSPAEQAEARQRRVAARRQARQNAPH